MPSCFRTSKLGDTVRIEQNAGLNLPSSEPTAANSASASAETATLRSIDDAAILTSPTLRSQDQTVFHIKGWRRGVLWPLTTILAAWYRSLRIDLGPDALYLLRDHPHAVIYVLWHNRLFLTPEIFRRFRKERPLHALISASRDGAWLSDFFSIVGIQAVRGSSSRRGREALSGLIEEIRAGHDIGVTPDGPRGPRYEFKNGALTVARRTRAPIVLLGMTYESAWKLGSWDRFLVPKPFSRTRVCARLIQVSDAEKDEELTPRLRAELLALNAENTSPSPTIV